MKSLTKRILAALLAAAFLLALAGCSTPGKNNTPKNYTQILHAPALTRTTNTI